MTQTAVDERVAIRAHYERFPATVKGAFVMRGADRNPHQVVIRDARIAELASGRLAPIGVEPVTLDVAPNLDLFVPFEFPLLDQEAGWYALECDIVVDGDPAIVRPGRRFAVPWPRATVRRGSVQLSMSVTGAAGPVRLGSIECRGDCVEVTYEADAPAEVELFVDDEELTVIDHTFDEAGGAKVTAYPVLRSHERLRLTVDDAPPIEVELP